MPFNNKEYSKEYVRKNRERLNEYSREYNRRNKDKRKQYYLDNLERYTEYNKLYRARIKELKCELQNIEDLDVTRVSPKAHKCFCCENCKSYTDYRMNKLTNLSLL